MNKYMSRKIGKRWIMLFAMNFTIFSILFVVLYFTQVDFLSESLLSNIDDNMEEQAYNVELENGMLSERECRKYAGLNIIYYDSEGKLIHYKGNYYNILDKVYSMGELGHHTLSYPTIKYRVYVREVNIEEARYVKIVKDVTDIMYYTNKSNEEATMSILIGIPISILLCLYLSFMQTRPYKQSMERNNEFTSDLSHEIKTPLAVTKYNIDSILAEPNSKVEDISHKLIVSLGQINYLNKLTVDLLHLARSSNGEFIVNSKEVDMNSELEDLLILYEYLALSQEKQFSYNIQTKESVLVDIDIIKRLCVIALDNAFKYTKPCDNVSITISQISRNLVIRVSDTGPGVAKEDMKKIFKRFYRIDKSRDSQTGGTGLGLPIALTLVKAMKGRINCSANIPNGFIIEFVLNLDKNPKNKQTSES